MIVNKNDDRASEKQKIIDNAVRTVIITVDAQGKMEFLSNTIDLNELIEILGAAYDEHVRRAEIMCEMTEDGKFLQ